MAEMNSAHRYGQCRCCLNVGYHKDIAEPYHRNGARETYRDTFLKCFNLVLSTNTKLTNMICTSCISRLNDASEFVTMVVESEKQLLKQINNTSDIEFINVTEDYVGGVCNNEEDDSKLNLIKVEVDINCSNVEYDINVKEEKKSINNIYVSIKQECDMEFDSVEDKEMKSQNDGNMQFDKNISLKQEDNESNDIDGKEMNTQVAAVNSQVNVNSTTDLKLTTQEAEHIAADMDLSRKKQKTHACKICDKKFTQKCNLKNHIKIHTGEKLFNCKICNKKFNNNSNLNMHIRIHKGEKPYACKICDKKFTQRGSLKSHIRTHTGERPYACKICDKKYIHSGDLKKHVRTHTDEKPYACEICAKKFNTTSHLSRHIETHRGDKPYACDICEKKFALKRYLILHVRTHTGERRYSCEICGKKFIESNALRKHVRIHTGEKPYACEICDKKFSLNHCLKAHVRTHTGEKPHACKICNKKFARNDRLTRHVRTHAKQKHDIQGVE